MREFSELRGLITEGYPRLVLELTGPWFDRGREDEEIWIANFKDREFSFAQINSGASGQTPEMAMEKGLVFLAAWSKVLEDGGAGEVARKAGEDAMDVWEDQFRAEAISTGPKA